MFTINGIKNLGKVSVIFLESGRNSPSSDEVTDDVLRDLFVGVADAKTDTANIMYKGKLVSLDKSEIADIQNKINQNSFTQVRSILDDKSNKLNIAKGATQSNILDNQKVAEIQKPREAYRGEVTNVAIGQAIMKSIPANAPKKAEYEKTLSAMGDSNNMNSLLRLFSTLDESALHTLYDNLADKDDNGNLKGTYSTNMVANNMLKYAYAADGYLGGREINALGKALKLYKEDADFKSLLVPFVRDAKVGVDATVTARTQSEKSKPITPESLTDTYDSTIDRALVAKIITDMIKADKDFLSKLAIRIGAKVGDLGDMKAKLFIHLQRGLKAGMSLQNTLTGVSLQDVSNADVEGMKKIDTEVQKKIDALKNKTTTTTEEKNVLDAYNKDPSRFTGEIRKVAQAMMINIGKDAMGVGVGQTYELFVKNLTLSWGAGVGQGDKKFTPGLVLHYGSGAVPITTTENYTITGHVGVGASLVGFVPFVDGGISATDKIKVFGAGAYSQINTSSVDVMIGKGTGSVIFSRVNDRMAGLDQYESMQKQVMLNLAQKTDMLTAQTIEQELRSAGYVLPAGNDPEKKFFDANVKNLLTSIRETYKQFSIKDDTESAVKLRALNAMVRTDMHTLHADEATNTADGNKSFAGGALGFFFIGGKPAPVAGLAFYEHHLTEGGARASRGATRSISEKVKTRDGTPAKSEEWKEPSVVEVPSGLKVSRLDELSKRAPQILAFAMSDGGKNLLAQWNRARTGQDLKDSDNDGFDKLIDSLSNGNQKNKDYARYLVTTYAAISGLAEKRAFREEVGAMTSGSMLSREMGATLYGKDGQNDDAAKTAFSSKYLTEGKPELSKLFNGVKGGNDGLLSIARNEFGNEFDSEYTKDSFSRRNNEGITSVQSETGGQIVGVVQYDQRLRGAKGLSPLLTGTPSFGKPVEVTDKGTYLNKLISEFQKNEPDRWVATKNSLGLDDAQLVRVLQGQEVILANKNKIKLSSDLKVKKTLIAVPGAVCFNAVMFMDIPKISISTYVPATPGTEDTYIQVDRSISEHHDYGRDFSAHGSWDIIGVSGGRNTPRKGPATTDPGHQVVTGPGTGGALTGVSVNRPVTVPTAPTVSQVVNMPSATWQQGVLAASASLWGSIE